MRPASSTSSLTPSSRACSSSRPGASSTPSPANRTCGRWEGCGNTCRGRIRRFLIGAIAIAGVPFFSGFFSKDAILAQAFAQRRYRHLGPRARGRDHDRVLYVPADFPDVLRRGAARPRRPSHHLHESPPIMTVPLVDPGRLLASSPAISACPPSSEKRPTSSAASSSPSSPRRQKAIVSPGTEWLLILASVAAAALGIAVAFWFYLQKPRDPARPRRPVPRASISSSSTSITSMSSTARSSSGRSSRARTGSIAVST